MNIKTLELEGYTFNIPKLTPKEAIYWGFKIGSSMGLGGLEPNEFDQAYKAFLKEVVVSGNGLNPNGEYLVKGPNTATPNKTIVEDNGIVMIVLSEAIEFSLAEFKKLEEHTKKKQAAKALEIQPESLPMEPLMSGVDDTSSIPFIGVTGSNTNYQMEPTQ